MTHLSEPINFKHMRQQICDQVWCIYNAWIINISCWQHAAREPHVARATLLKRKGKQSQKIYFNETKILLM
jgi:hypothetical protein